MSSPPPSGIPLAIARKEREHTVTTLPHSIILSTDARFELPRGLLAISKKTSKASRAHLSGRDKVWRDPRRSCRAGQQRFVTADLSSNYTVIADNVHHDCGGQGLSASPARSQMIGSQSFPSFVSLHTRLHVLLASAVNSRPRGTILGSASAAALLEIVFYLKQIAAQVIQQLLSGKMFLWHINWIQWRGEGGGGRILSNWLQFVLWVLHIRFSHLHSAILPRIINSYSANEMFFLWGGQRSNHYFEQCMNHWCCDIEW